jgi:hypothetical protein
MARLPEFSDVPQIVCDLIEKAAAPCGELASAASLPPHVEVWYEPDQQTVCLQIGVLADMTKVAALADALTDCQATRELTSQYGSGPPDLDSAWLHVKRANGPTLPQIFGPVAHAMQLRPGPINDMLGFRPTPLASMIAGGALGAGLGYGGGWLAEQLLPRSVVRRGNLRRTLAALGGLAGAAPGASWALNSYRHAPEGQSGVLSSWPWTDAEMEHFKTTQGSELPRAWLKYADSGYPFAGRIPVDQFNRVVWNDLRSAGGYTSPPLAAATTGILQAASLSRGANLVTPVDIARIGLGMGSGYISGLVAGKVLGALAGLTPPAQQRLQQAGVWAGMLSNVIPGILGN